jgi:hypothetical protein
MGKITGEIKYKKVYLYSIYSFPLKEYRDEAIKLFDNRWRNGERCFGVDENYAKEIMDGNYSSYFIIVHEKNTEDYASATIKIGDHCQIDDKTQAFIFNLCRHGTKTSVVSPVKVLFDVIGKHIYKSKIKYLYLNPQPGEGINTLIDIYKKYGFRKTYCPKNKHYTMRKKITFQKKSFSNKKTV